MKKLIITMCVMSIVLNLGLIGIGLWENSFDWARLSATLGWTVAWLGWSQYED